MKTSGYEYAEEALNDNHTIIQIKMPMGAMYERKKSARKSFLPVKIKDGKVWPLEYHGSAHIFALTEAQGLIAIPVGTTLLKEGEIVDVRQI